MNIFWLHQNPSLCAKSHCDKHIVKMILEYAQLMSTAHRVLDKENASALVYKETHKNHPCAVWVRESRENYLELFELWCECLGEYQKRYSRVHLCQQKLLFILCHPPNKIPRQDSTPKPSCMPEEAKVSDVVVENYRNLYNTSKAYMCKWKTGEIPPWFKG